MVFSRLRPLRDGNTVLGQPLVDVSAPDADALRRDADERKATLGSPVTDSARFYTGDINGG